MVTECGMSEDIGPVFVENTESPDMRRRIDGEVSRILQEAYSRVKALLVRSFCQSSCEARWVDVQQSFVIAWFAWLLPRLGKLAPVQLQRLQQGIILSSACGR